MKRFTRTTAALVTTAALAAGTVAAPNSYAAEEFERNDAALLSSIFGESPKSEYQSVYATVNNDGTVNYHFDGYYNRQASSRREATSFIVDAPRGWKVNQATKTITSPSASFSDAKIGIEMSFDHDYGYAVEKDGQTSEWTLSSSGRSGLSPLKAGRKIVYINKDDMRSFPMPPVPPEYYEKMVKSKENTPSTTAKPAPKETTKAAPKTTAKPAPKTTAKQEAPKPPSIVVSDTQNTSETDEETQNAINFIIGMLVMLGVVFLASIFQSQNPPTEP